MSSDAPPVRERSEPQGLTLTDYLEIVRRRKRELIWPTVVLFSIIAIVVALLPNKYLSIASIMIEQGEVPDEFVRTTVLANTRQQLGVTSERLLTTDNIGAIIEKHGLYPELVADTSVREVASMVRASVQVEMVDARQRNSRLPEGAVGFVVAYEGRSPEAAQIVVKELTELFLKENVIQRQQAARETTRFLAQEADRLANEVSEVEARLASFRETHMNVLPEMQNTNLTLMQRAEERLQRSDEDLRAVDGRIANIRSDMAKLNPSPHLDRLMALEAEYASLAATFTERHPDRVRLRRELETLRGDAGGVVRVTNPEYLALQSALQAAVTDRQLHLSTRAEIQARLDELEQRLSRTPVIEGEYRALTREHDSAVERLRGLRADTLQAQLAESLEAESRAERYVLLRPASLPTRPTSPNRRALLILGFVFSLGAGAGTVVLRESLDHSVHGTAGVLRATGVPPVAVIPYLLTDAEFAALRWRRLLLSLGVVAYVVAALVYVHYQLYPLDELFSDPVEQPGLGPDAHVGTEP
jgi:polysaccharide biosynthesis transport protein